MPVIVTTAHLRMAEEIQEEANLVLVKPISSAVLKRKAVELAQR
jgi:hypothetical protein